MPEDPTTTATGEEPSAADRVADAVSIASDFGIAWVALCALQVLTGRRGAAEALRRLAAAGFTSLALTRILKHHFGIDRDVAAVEGLRARAPSSSRFPSGHTLAAFAAAMALPRTTAGRLGATAAATTVAWSRVRVGHHRPEDVAAGAIVGAVAGAGLSVLLDRLDGS